MAIDWKTIISEFDGKPTLLQAIGKLRKAVEDETITIQQAQAEIAKLESQQKADEALIKTAQSTADEAKINAYNASQKGDQALGKATTAGTKAQAADTKAQAADTKAQQALDLATTNENNISVLDGQVTEIEKTINNVALLKHDNDFTTNGNEFNFLNVDAGQTSGWLNYRTVGAGRIINNISFANGDGNGTLVNISCADPLQYNHAATKHYVDSNIKNQDFKAIFGNQSLVGTGNIDLYRHDIAVTFSSADSNDIHVEFISSKNTVCDSFQDLKTVLGDSFRISANGTVFGIFDELSTQFVAEYMRETGIQTFYKETGSDFGAKFISFADNPFSLSDTVTTI